MKTTKFKAGNKKAVCIEFNNMAQFLDYINTKQASDLFKQKEELNMLESLRDDEKAYRFTGTRNYNEAVELMQNGWLEVAQELNKRLKKTVSASTLKNKRTFERRVSVQGATPIVPLYLQGVPSNMQTTNIVQKKNKVITVNVNIGYNGGASVEKIKTNAFCAIETIRNLEASGYKCNLNIFDTAYEGSFGYVLKIKVKNAGERLNVSKLSFPLCHPSMLRRFTFRFAEVWEGLKFKYPEYGWCMNESMYENAFSGEYILPQNSSFNETNIDACYIK